MRIQSLAALLLAALCICLLVLPSTTLARKDTTTAPEVGAAKIEGSNGVAAGKGGKGGKTPKTGALNGGGGGGKSSKKSKGSKGKGGKGGASAPNSAPAADGLTITVLSKEGGEASESGSEESEDSSAVSKINADAAAAAAPAAAPAAPTDKKSNAPKPAKSAKVPKAAKVAKEKGGDANDIQVEREAGSSNPTYVGTTTSAAKTEEESRGKSEDVVCIGCKEESQTEESAGLALNAKSFKETIARRRSIGRNVSGVVAIIIMGVVVTAFARNLRAYNASPAAQGYSFVLKDDGSGMLVAQNPCSPQKENSLREAVMENSKANVPLQL